jgi:hypothetical protein
MTSLEFASVANAVAREAAHWLPASWGLQPAFERPGAA